VQTPDDPKRRAVYGKTRAEAAGKLAKAIAERNGGSPIAFDPEKLKVGEYLNRWLEVSAKTSVGENTFDRYTAVVRNDLAPAFGGLGLQKLTTAHVEGLKAQLLTRDLAPGTVRYILGVLSAALNRAVKWNLTLKNPVSDVSRPKDKGKKMRALSEEEATALVEVVRGTRHEAMYLVALKLGLRQGELAGLMWEDLDLERGVVSVRRSVATNQAGSRWGTIKGGEEKVIRISPGMVKSLKVHRKLQLEEQVAAREWEDHGLVFPNRFGRVNRKNCVHRDFDKHLAAAELPSKEVRFHDLRYTAATLAIRAGTPISVVSKMLGHKDPAMTLRRYSHVLDEMQDEAAKRMDEYGF
jgi:integrase